MNHCRFCGFVLIAPPLTIKSPMLEQGQVNCTHCGAIYGETRLVLKEPKSVTTMNKNT